VAFVSPAVMKDLRTNMSFQDLTMDDQVDQRLKNNPKVRVNDAMYAYQVRRTAS
jgi:hypothetical protein